MRPNKAKKYFQAIGLKTKNDQMDAVGLARMSAEQSLDAWQPLDDFFYTLRAFTRHYESLTAMKPQMRNQLHADQHSIYSNKEVIKKLKKLISTLDSQIEKTSTEIHHHIYSQPDVAEKIRLLLEIKGLGVLSIATVLAETNGFALFKKISQLVSYAGYDVVENQSGGHRAKTRISKKGNRHIRRILYMPALVAIRCETGNIKAFFDRIIEKAILK